MKNKQKNNYKTALMTQGRDDGKIKQMENMSPEIKQARYFSTCVERATFPQPANGARPDCAVCR
uniref:Uncharacterized protein n=1 Tax=Anguilla anguilla TaxID=7936 RepID=A0A0E9Q4Z6_ANGAN